jgi:hypothetical protein
MNMMGPSFAIDAVKQFVNFAKGMVSARDSAIFQAMAIQFERQISEALTTAIKSQTEHLSLLERVSDLEKEVADLKAWDADKEKYRLAKIGAASTAYVLKEHAEVAGKPHYFCANCYEDLHLSYLQQETRSPGRCSVWVCHRCGADIYETGQWQPEHAKRDTSRKVR